VGLLNMLGELLSLDPRRTRGGGRPAAAPQLELALAAAPRPEAPALPPPEAPAPGASPRPRPTAADAEALLADLRRLGLRGIERLRFTRNRTVMVSFSRGELRVHEGYRDAPPEVRRAVAAFVCGRTKADRRRAREVILAYQVPRGTLPPPRRARPRPEDEPAVAQLRRFHAHYNRVYFGGRLKLLPIRLSARMVTRLGHYTAASPAGDPAEIVIGREHIRRHGWEEALHTLLHEMVHQWQDEVGHPIDHGATFRRKAREVGITASARRHVVPMRRARPAVPPPSAVTIGLRAARQD
jgi:hypothetical protein